MSQDVLKNFDGACADMLSWYKKRISAIRTGRATPQLVEDIIVEAYGQRQPLKHISTISVPKLQTLVVQLWDKGLVPDVERALLHESLGAQPVIESGIIRIDLPPLTEERRLELVKTLKEITEEARVRLRRSRDEIWRRIQEDERKKAISEDEKFRLKDELEKKVDVGKEKLESLYNSKEREILNI